MKAEIFNYQKWVQETNSEKLKTNLELFLRESNYTVLNFIEHLFEPQGFTAIWLLAESHLAVHTFPEDGKTYIELSGCNREMTEQFAKLLEKWVADLG